ncbi:hypothetical protein H2198_010448 [Neophaeococcomyces mojaviensis]|uniref:Uncharacterized protein n=1 Tax=Neophaeococcomyces mojaviensis TaxID=3383035 RepID=A0ACC2ZRI0_9EURO|nr:hypothetical protein H2198_010448 [Knufia sp. JES_112]
MAEPQIQNSSVQNTGDDDETDAILAELEAEADDTSSATYQQRIQELQANASNPASSGVSRIPATTTRQDLYVTLKSDDDTLRFTTEHERAVVHFRHPDFARCATMDTHLLRIAQRHSLGEASGDEVAFGTVDVTHAPFVVEKLGVRVLPCLIGFAKGVVKGKVVGFEGICWDGKEGNVKVSKALEETLFSWNLLKQKMLGDEGDSDEEDGMDDERKIGYAGGKRGIRAAKHRVTDDDDDWD